MRQLLIDAGESPDEYVYDPRTDKVERAKLAPSATSALMREAVTSLLPSAAAALGFTGGAAAVGSRFPHPLAMGAGGLLGGLGAGMIAEPVQEAILDNPPILKKEIGEFQRNRSLGRAAHPYAAAAGQFIGSIPSFGMTSPRGLRGLASLVGLGKIDKKAVATLLANTGLQTGLNLGTAELTGQLDNMTPDEKAAMVLQSVASATQQGGMVTRRAAKLFGPATMEHLMPTEKPATGERDLTGFGDAPVEATETAAPDPTTNFKQVTPYTDDEINVIMQASEWNPPKATPFDRAISEGKKRGILRTPEDYKRVLESPNPDAELRGIYMKQHEQTQAQMTPEQRQEQLMQTMSEGEKKARDEFKKSLEGFNEERQSLDEEIKLLDETPVPAGELGTRWQIKQQKLMKLKEIEARQAKVEADYAARWPQPPMPLVPVDRPPMQAAPAERLMLGEGAAPEGEPHGPAIPMGQGGIISPEAHGPAIPLADAPNAEYLRRLQQAQMHGEVMSPAERDKLSSGSNMTTPEREALMGYAEGEQGLPFSEGLGSSVHDGLEASPTPPIDPHRPQGAYGGFPVGEALDNLLSWFGKSKIVDREGKPRVMYHITKHDFDTFNTDPKKLHYGELGSHFGTLQTIGAVRGLAKAENARVLPVYLRIENPLRLPDMFPLGPKAYERQFGKIEKYIKDSRVVEAFREYYENGKPSGISKLKQRLEAAGYDGIVYDNAAEGGGYSYIAFKPEQVKSATGNRGTFDPHQSNIMYSGFPVHDALNELWTSAKQFAKDKNITIQDISPLHVLWRFTKQASARFAESSPLGAYVSSRLQNLFHERDFIANTKIARTELFKDFLKDPRAIEWLQRQTDGRTWDVASLPPELQPVGEAFVKHVESYIDEMRARGQKVMRSNGNAWVWRDPEKIAGYFPWSIDRKIWKEITGGGAKAAQRKKEWMDNWKKWNPADSEDIAEETFRDLIEPISAKRVIGGEPVFNQFRKTHGTPIPKEWRDLNVYETLQNYNRNYGVDAAWTAVVQKDPLMRLAFGIARDHQGVDVRKADRAIRPTKSQWGDIFREADRFGAAWAKDAKPDMELGNPLLDDNDGNARALLSSYSQRPTYKMTGFERGINHINQVAGSMMMQTLSGVRDISSALASTAEYMTGPGKAAAVKALAQAIVDPRGAIEKAQAGGAMQHDVFAHQGEEVVSRAVYKAVRSIRGLTGRNFLDELGKAITYNVAHDTVEWQLRNLGESPLAKEFGPTGQMSIRERAKATAAALVQKASPSYDVRNLPAAFVPQTQNFLGHLFRLSTWGVARFNNWIVDSYLPMVRHGSFERFIASIGFGILGAAATQSLTELIRQRKPADLTWQEWMGLSSEDQQKEFAPMLFAMMQAQGTMGIASDLAAPVSKALSGKTTQLNDLSPQMPAVIMGKDIAHTLADFWLYAAQREHLDKYDMIDLAHELAKSMQLYRDLQKPLGVDTSEQEANREKAIYEGMTRRSAVTDKPLQPKAFTLGPVAGGKFSLSKAFNTRTPGAGLEELVPDLVRAAQEGRTVNVKPNTRTLSYYQNIATREGERAGEEALLRDQQETNEDRLRKQIASGLRSLRPLR